MNAWTRTVTASSESSSVIDEIAISMILYPSTGRHGCVPRTLMKEAIFALYDKPAEKVTRGDRATDLTDLPHTRRCGALGRAMNEQG
jgi:hypothetical protein